MNLEKIFNDTDFVRWSGTEEELKVANYLCSQCEAMGVSARLEAFPVERANIISAKLEADGKEIPMEAFYNCGSGEVEGELYYMPDLTPMSMAGAKDKIVLLDAHGIRYFPYQDLMKVGPKALIFQSGNMNYPDHDIDKRDLRAHVVGDAPRVLCAMIHVSDAVELVKNEVKTIKLSIKQDEFMGESHNVIAEIPGKRNEWITLSAHYDSTSLSHGAYDNMSGCAGLLGIMEQLKDKDLNYGLRFVFCGSEERGLLGSKAYVRDHADELEQIPLNINLDMIGTIMGKMVVMASAEENLAGYVKYMGAELSFPVNSKVGIYSSDSSSFADKGVPAISFARRAGDAIAPIHCRYDIKDVLSMKQLQKDIDFIAEFTRRMANAMLCPVSREIPEKVKKELDVYMSRTRN